MIDCVLNGGIVARHWSSSLSGWAAVRVGEAERPGRCCTGASMTVGGRDWAFWGCSCPHSAVRASTSLTTYRSTQKRARKSFVRSRMSVQRRVSELRSDILPSSPSGAGVLRSPYCLLSDAPTKDRKCEGVSLKQTASNAHSRKVSSGSKSARAIGMTTMLAPR